MKNRWLPGLSVGLLALATLPCRAQEGTKPESIPAPLPEPVKECGVPCMVPVEKITHTYRLFWLEREAPLHSTKVTIREEKCGQEVRMGYEIDYREEKGVRTETILKPREVVKDVTVCTMHPEKVTDPVTGCCTIIMKPVTEVKQVREIIYETVCETKEFTLRIPYLKPVPRTFEVKKLVADILPDTKIVKERFGVLGPVEIKETVLMPAAPACPSCATGKCLHHK